MSLLKTSSCVITVFLNIGPNGIGFTCLSPSLFLLVSYVNENIQLINTAASRIQTNRNRYLFFIHSKHFLNIRVILSRCCNENSGIIYHKDPGIQVSAVIFQEKSIAETFFVCYIKGRVNQRFILPVCCVTNTTSSAGSSKKL
jgi:hypothetical protein